MSARNRSKSGMKNHVVSFTFCVDPFAYIAFKGSRHLQPERLPSARRERAISIRLLDTSDNTLEHVKRISSSVRHLFMSGLHMKTVPGDLLSNLLDLQKLDLGLNGIVDGGLPESVNQLQQLVELNLSGNRLSKFPMCLHQLKSLRRLNVSNNGLKNIEGVSAFKRLQTLIIDHNKLTNILTELKGLKHLEILYCGNNEIQDIGSDIRFLTSLTYLDMSFNKVTSLPVEIFLLPRLKVLNACYNQISMIPFFSARPRNTGGIENVDLSNNFISKFPEHLLLLCGKLYLDSNRIKVLAWKVIKTLKWNSGKILVLTNNPLTFPPPEVCEGGLHSIQRFYADTLASRKTYQRLKVMVLGSYSSGKTCLVHSLVDQQSRLHKQSKCSGGIEIHEVAFECTTGDFSGVLQLSIWDFCGYPSFVYPHHLFYQLPSITLLTFNVSSYTEDDFHSVIGSWFDWLIAKTKQITILLVGTHADLISKEETTQVVEFIKKGSRQYMDTRRELIEKEIKAISEKPHITRAMSRQLKSYISLLQAELFVYSDIVLTSSADYSGFDCLQTAIKAIASNKVIFPNVMRPIPTFWEDVADYLEEKGNAMVVPIMNWHLYEKEVTEKFGMAHLIEPITRVLHDTGKIIWLSNHHVLKRKLILRPSWMFDVLRHILRYRDDESLSCHTKKTYCAMTGVSGSQLDKLQAQLAQEGVLDQEFLKYLLSPILPMEHNSTLVAVFELLIDLEFGYLVYNTPGNANGLWPVVKPQPPPSGILIPWLHGNRKPENIAETSSARKLTAVYDFRKFMPMGIFEALCVRANLSEHKLLFRSHMQHKLCARHVSGMAMVTLLRSERSGASLLEIIVSATPSAPSLGTFDMWKIISPLLTEAEDILLSFPGAWFDRWMACPHCQSFGSFPGEWLNPMETLGTKTKICESCELPVDINFLIQPKEKPRNDDFERFAERRQKQRLIMERSRTEIRSRMTDRQFEMTNQRASTG